jgi:cytochrome c oxidase cbb3-type subunit 3
MRENKSDKLLEHDYDGIQEFDNPLPSWWLATFYGAVVFSVFYFGYYHIGPGASPEMEMEEDLAAVRSIQKSKQGNESPLTEADLMAVFNDSGKRQLGAAVFKDKCSSCHGMKGEGLIGPNLTDDFWLHGNGTLLAIMQTVSDGVPEKGMPPWKGLLKKEEILDVVAHVKGLRGSHPANAKASQGIEVKQQ